MVNIYGTLGPAWRKREGAGGDVFTGNDRNAAEPVPCYARRVRGSDWKDEARSRKCGVKPQLLVDLQGPGTTNWNHL